jgi:hypothetical protein
MTALGIALMGVGLGVVAWSVALPPREPRCSFARFAWRPLLGGLCVGVGLILLALARGGAR